MDIPSGLGERGLIVWESLKSGDDSRDVLVVEAARLADRLDELDNIIQGKGVLNLMQFRVLNREFDEDAAQLDINIEVKFQNVLSEARQQQMAFAAVLDKIDKLGLTARVPKGGQVESLPSGVTPLDKMREQMRERAGKRIGR